jgi:N-acetylmuramoyl-L-alanine amidase
MLIETAFISNPEEEKRLLSGDYQARLAGAIARGIKTYFAANPPPGTRWAGKGGRRQASVPKPVAGGRQHVIGKGDTLERIAQQYEVSLSALRSANKVEAAKLRIGDVLIIPEG